MALTHDERAHLRRLNARGVRPSRIGWDEPIYSLPTKTEHPLYGSWYMMLKRCENPRYEGYKDYGGRGITVCPEWHDFWTFARWIEENIGPRPPGTYPSGRALYSLDRKNNDGNYEPGNVRWADALTQAHNQRTWALVNAARRGCDGPGTG
jgi:hypothetical protein